MQKSTSLLTPEACRAARGILKWSVRDLAQAADLAFTTVHRFEQTGSATDRTKLKMIDAFAENDIEIIDQERVTGAKLHL
jgi:hypothetical protein